MQHIENQKPQSQIKNMILHERWEKITGYLTYEQVQRLGHINECLEGLEDRILKDIKIEQSKNKVIIQEINKLKINASQVKQIAIQGPSKENQVRSSYQQKTSSYISQYQQKADQSNKQTSDSVNKRISQVATTFAKNNSLVIKKTQDTVQELKKQADMLYQLVDNQKNKHTKALVSMKEDIDKEIQNISECILQIKENRRQSQRKLQQMLIDLDQILKKVVNQQIKAGQTTYECLMKLFEDTCSRMQQNLLK